MASALNVLLSQVHLFKHIHVDLVALISIFFFDLLSLQGLLSVGQTPAGVIAFTAISSEEAAKYAYHSIARLYSIIFLLFL